MNRTRMRCAEVMVLLLLLSGVLLPSTVLARTTSPLNAIINNLRQISGAQDQWAIEAKHTGPVPVRHEDIAPYLRNGWVNPVADEAYILTTTDRDPLAVLTRRVGDIPVGTVIQLGDPSFVLPPNAQLTERSTERKRLVLVLMLGTCAVGAVAFLVKRAVR